MLSNSGLPKRYFLSVVEKGNYREVRKPSSQVAVSLSCAFTSVLLPSDGQGSIWFMYVLLMSINLFFYVFVKQPLHLLLVRGKAAYFLTSSDLTTSWISWLVVTVFSLLLTHLIFHICCYITNTNNIKFKLRPLLLSGLEIEQIACSSEQR